MITQVLKGTFNDPNTSWMHGKPCVAIFMESIEFNRRFVTYISTPNYSTGEYPASHSIEHHEGDMLKMNDDHIVVWSNKTREPKIGDPITPSELKEYVPTIAEIFGNNIGELHVTFK